MALTESPRLAPLYVRAALGARAHRGDVLPTTQYTLAAQPIDVDSLAAYQRVCGFRVGDTVPATYPHVVAFPLAMQLMVQRDLPFPLPGLVHVANSITQHRPLRLDESITVRVQRPTSDRIRPAGSSTWSRRRRLTRTRCGRAAARICAGTIQLTVPPRSVLNRSCRPGRPRSRCPAIGRRYAAVCGDRNPIHLSAATAKTFGFPRAIAHGIWLASRGLASLEGRLADAFRYDVAFKTPVLLPAKALLTTSGNRSAWALDLRDARTGKPHLAGTVTAIG